ncbi:MAG: phosphoglucosamine mutase [Sphingomonadales bacterium]
MSRKLFGTDGIRGTTNSFPMTPEIAMCVGMAAGRYFVRGNHRHRVVIGKDTRLSGYMLEPALTAGFAAVGMDVVLVGPMPTPAVAMLTKSLRADLGVMLSASHNPFHDNGIKLFGPDGYKLSDAVELEIEARMNGDMNKYLAKPAELGRVRRLEDARGRYIEFAKSTFPPKLSLDGLKVVVDCANGAAYQVAPTVLWELGAEVVVIGNKPDGFNINDKCGSTAPEAMCEAVARHGADIGIALDGDADRLILADERGQIVDGDQLMALIGTSWAASQRLRGNGIVATVMSNLAFERYLQGCGIDVVRTKVGDRYVVEQMRARGYNVGGEQSGHIIINDFTTTGDGLIAALQVMAVIVGAGKSASESCRLFTPLPQLMKNVRFGAVDPLTRPDVKKAIAAGEARLGEKGRLLIRKSGTEPVVRVMAEGEDPALIANIVDEIVGIVETAA